MTCVQKESLLLFVVFVSKDIYLLKLIGGFMSKEIKVTVKGSETLPLNKLEPFQGSLKNLSDENYEKLKATILKLGFSFAVHVWKNNSKYYILDGHQRIWTVNKMIDEEGYSCPRIPINIVSAKNIKEAKRKVLAAASQYGSIQKQGLHDFINEASISFEELELSFDFPEIELQNFKESFVDPKKEKKKKAVDLTHKGQTVMTHTCPNCNFEFDTTDS